MDRGTCPYLCGQERQWVLRRGHAPTNDGSILSQLRSFSSARAHTHTHITVNMLTIIDEMELQKEPPKVNHSL